MDIVGSVTGFVGGLYTNFTNIINTYLPQVSGFLTDVPFVGNFLGNVTNTEWAVIGVLVLLTLYIRKAEWIIKWFTVGVVVIVCLILFGVVNV